MLLASLTRTPIRRRSQPANNPTYARMKAYLDAVPAIDTHDHLWPFDKLPGLRETENGKGMNLAGLWRNSYLTRVKQLTPWTPGGKFADWWAKAKHDFDDVRATSFYRYQAVAFQDLYGVDFDRITDDQAGDLDRRIFRNYLTEGLALRGRHREGQHRADVQRPVLGPVRLPHGLPVRRAGAQRHDPDPRVPPVGVQAARTTTRTRSRRPTACPLNSLDDYLAVLDRLFAEAKEKGAVCLKTTLAYQRTLDFDRVPAERAAKAFGRPRVAARPRRR